MVSDRGIFSFGDASFYGSLGGSGKTVSGSCHMVRRADLAGRPANRRVGLGLEFLAEVAGIGKARGQCRPTR